ncbi:HlyD family efflux transporter periplasmic adaptor subunit [Candidatus Dactylopiibacterium carminicum]|uniref:HlyD family efflux transporter periplasmic adaptor subunit n=1 Tax=Candidatus Dactylopiibacterium carminicum TaxID=857335 RepID=UPI0014834393|nr:HlyD family efflux transporter periplasmic adaptor subunit [Candidatus Dactylopiibacterium carminicum]
MRAPVAARVDDTLYRIGEWVPAGSPVVSLLAPEALKVRFFVAQAALPHYAPGTRLRVGCDGCGEPFAATVDFVANSPEFTPPVIYSQKNRARLVFLVEARPDQAQVLRPGQPVDVRPETTR